MTTGAEQCVHELPRAQCAYCSPRRPAPRPPEAFGDEVPRRKIDEGFPALYPGICAGECGGEIEPGDMIRSSEDGWAHAGCVHDE